MEKLTVSLIMMLTERQAGSLNGNNLGTSNKYDECRVGGEQWQTAMVAVKE